MRGVKRGMEGYGNVREKIDQADKKITEGSHKLVTALGGKMGAYLAPA